MEETQLKPTQHPYFSWGTLLTGLGAAWLDALVWDWTTGLLLAVLIYAHECGHVLAARYGGGQVLRAPLFIPGMGALVMTRVDDNLWRTTWSFLGGPVVGAGAALLVKEAGIFLHNPSAAFAGDLALVINLWNLAPVSSLDGGRVTSRLGYLRVPATLLILLAGWSAGVSPDVLCSFGVVALVCQFWDHGKADLPRKEQLQLLAVYTGAASVIALALAYSGPVAEIPIHFGPLAIIALAGLGYWLLSLWADDWIQEARSTRKLYLLTTFFRGPKLWLIDPWRAQVLACLTANAIGLPGLKWLRALLDRLAAESTPDVLEWAVSGGYLSLDARGKYALADQWITATYPYVRAAGPQWEAKVNQTTGDAFTVALLASFLPPAEAAEASHEIALQCLHQESPGIGYLFANAACRLVPENPLYAQTWMALYQQCQSTNPS